MCEKTGIFQGGAFLMESASPLLTKDFQIFYGDRGAEGEAAVGMREE